MQDHNHTEELEYAVSQFRSKINQAIADLLEGVGKEVACATIYDASVSMNQMAQDYDFSYELELKAKQSEIDHWLKAGENMGEKA